MIIIKKTNAQNKQNHVRMPGRRTTTRLDATSLRCVAVPTFSFFLFVFITAMPMSLKMGARSEARARETELRDHMLLNRHFLSH